MWHIVSDSSCDLFTLPEEDSRIDFRTIPFSIRIGQKEYIDDEHLNLEAMLSDNESHTDLAQTACPSPEAWRKEFAAEGPVLAFTISSALSGSYNSACTASAMIQEEEPGKQIAVIDTRATGAETVMVISEAVRLIQKGLSFDEIVSGLHAAAVRIHTIFALSSYHNLIKAGRVSRLKGFIAGHLGFWGIGVGTDEGEIAIRGRARGLRGMVRFLLEEMDRVGFAGNEVRINHCQNEEAAQELKRRLEESRPGVIVRIMATRGLDSFYAERHGLIVGY